MPYPRHYSKGDIYTKTKTEEAVWPAKSADYVTMVLASLAISTVIALFIIPQLQRSPFF
jgi:hypothetical protein